MDFPTTMGKSEHAVSLVLLC